MSAGRAGPGARTLPAGAPAPSGEPGGAPRPGLSGRTMVVLGGTGFLGLHIRAALEAAGASVLVVSRTDPEDGAPFAAMDLESASVGQLRSLLAESETHAVVNAAGRVWCADEREMEAANVRWVERLVRATAGLANPPRLIQLGSVHEYGPCPAGAAIAETRQAAPDNAYGRTKLLGTRLVLDAAREQRLDGVVLRVANALGPGAPRASLLGMVAHRLAEAARGEGAARTRPVVLRLAPLLDRRDFVDARDVAAAVVDAARASAAVSGRIVNIGSGQAVPVRRLVERLAELSGLPVRIDQSDGATRGAVSTAAQWQQLDIRLAHDLLGWQPVRSADDSLASLLAAA